MPDNDGDDTDMSTDAERKPVNTPTYEFSDSDDVSAALHRAIRALDEAVWGLDKMDRDDQRRVTRRLQHDLRVVRTVIEEQEKGNTDFHNYDVEEDRVQRLAERAPGE